MLAAQFIIISPTGLQTTTNFQWFSRDSRSCLQILGALAALVLQQKAKQERDGFEELFRMM